MNCVQCIKSIDIASCKSHRRPAAPLVSAHVPWRPGNATTFHRLSASKQRLSRRTTIRLWISCNVDGTTSSSESAASTEFLVSGRLEQHDGRPTCHGACVDSKDAALDDTSTASCNNPKSQEKVLLLGQEKQLENQGLLQQMQSIVMFAGPALGIWLSGPIMSLIDTAVVGNSSSLELAALGPGTVFCDQLGYLFMFLSVATSNLIATALARQDREEVAHHLSRLLFVGLVCGLCMLILSGAVSHFLLRAFVGSQNEMLVPAAYSYVQIRGLAWPAVLVGLVAQSASLGMQDSWGPLKVLAVASFLNALGDILFCTCLGYGIVGAAWATMLSQYVGGFLMLRSLSMKGYNTMALSMPSREELWFMLKLAAPVFLTIFSKVSFYSLVTYLCTSLGAVTLAAHQVMVGLYATCAVAAEPLSQTAQSFMPALIRGSVRNFKKAQTLLHSLMIIGVLSGVILGSLGLCVPWLCPQVFTHDTKIINQMRSVTFPLLWGLLVSPPLLALEGTLLAGRDLDFLSLTMVACFLAGAMLLMVCKRLGWGLRGFWWTMACFQTVRFCLAWARLTSKRSFLQNSQEEQPTPVQ